VNEQTSRNTYIWEGDSERLLSSGAVERTTEGRGLALTFLDPPFNQGKDYSHHDDDLPEPVYWEWMARVSRNLHSVTAEGGAIYFMQREKNTEAVLRCLRETGWTLQNLIIWKKKTSAVPGIHRYGKAYQIIAFATKGERPRVFHRLRIDPPRNPDHKLERENGLFLTDVWDDIRELTSGYFAGDEPLRDAAGQRFHKQQSPVSLLARIILSSSNPGDWICDPFAGTGTTSIVAAQLHRASIGIELDPENAKAIRERLKKLRYADDVDKLYKDYRCTERIEKIWGAPVNGEGAVKPSTAQIGFVFEKADSVIKGNGKPTTLAAPAKRQRRRYGDAVAA
jgi:site-specific DNA-methyltransferase (adenine-specific)